jgi:hypothetical protein
LLGFLLQSFCSTAQNTIQGIVLDKDKQSPLPDAVVILKTTNDEEILAYEFTDSQGKFSKNIPAGNDSVNIIVSMLGYTTQSLRTVNKSQQLKFLLEASEIILKEVTIKAPNIRKQNDTLHYNVAGFKSAQDRYIGDVLKKLPGVEVAESGGISYNGLPINNFYIEGLDLLGNRYSLATNNIPVDAVSNVQVIENHQRVQALKDIVRSDQAAINIKLKNNKMIKPIGTVDWALGMEPFLWNLKLFTMLVTPKAQALVTYKTTNTGTDLVMELTEHPLMINEKKPMLPLGLFSSSAFSYLPLEKNRYLFNKTHLFSLNNLWKVSQSKELRINVDYAYDERSQEIVNDNRYYFNDSDSVLVINEIDKQKNYNNIADIKLNYTDNSLGHFLEDAFKLSGKWVTENSSITGTNNVAQNYSMPLFYLENSLDYTKRTGEKVFKVTSFIRYSNQPQELTVFLDPLVYQEPNIRQDAARSVFYTDNNTSWSYRFNSKSRIFVDFRLQADLEDLNTEMNFIPFPEKQLSNDVRQNRFNYIISPSYTYNNTNFHASFSFPVSFADLYVNDHILNEKNHYNYPLINPSLSLSYKFSELWESALSAGYQNEIGDVFDFSEGIVMTNYRHFRVGSGIIEKRESQNYSWRLAFRDAINALFFNVNLSYRPTERNLLSDRTFIDRYSISQRQEIDNRRDIRSIRIHAGKYFDYLKTNLSLGASHSRTDFEQKQQNVLIPVTNKITIFESKIDTKLGDWGGLAYNGLLINSRNRFSETASVSLNQIVQNFSFFIFPAKRWQIKLRGEYLNNDISSDLSKKMFFGDIGIKYQLKSMEFSFDYTNIFNQKEYGYTSFNGVNTYSTKYNLRPANFLFSMSFKY